MVASFGAMAPRPVFAGAKPVPYTPPPVSFVPSPAQDKRFMQQAIKLSRDGFQSAKGGPFGAVIVKNGKAIGAGCNQVTSTNDSTAHAEVVAIRDAEKRLGTLDLSGSVLYSSCEPCPMCLGAAYWANVSKIIFANGRKDAESAGFRDKFIYDELKRTPAKRLMPTEQRYRDEAYTVFQQWNATKNKVLY